MSRLVLDTSAYSHLRRAHPRVLGAVSAAHTIIVSATVLGELEAAFRHGRRGRENRRSLADFLEEPQVVIHEVTAAVARRYGEVFDRLRSAGTPIPVNDIWIAAVTIDCGGDLLTFDRHFERVELLSCTILES